jgi:iron(III) transport system ATP-binding protein
MMKRLQQDIAESGAPARDKLARGSIDTAASRSRHVECHNISKYFTNAGTDTFALNNVSLNIRAGEMVVLLGPSGCGKTTLLRSIAGLEQPQAGAIEIGHKLVYSAAQKVWVPPEKRGVSMVFQSYALWPHMTVREIVAYPMVSRRMPSREAKRKAGEVLDMVGLGGLTERFPAQLSGGQQQRVALARAIAAETKVILFDEPLSNVDAKVRDQIRREITSLQQSLGFSGLYVTHDQIEAGALATTLAVMQHGQLAQIGPPVEIYEQPETKYVATFMGPTNDFDGRTTGPVGQRFVAVDTVLGPMIGSPRLGAEAAGVAVSVLFRPEAGQLFAEEPGGPNKWLCRLERKTFMGAFLELTLSVERAGRRLQIFVITAKHGFPDQPDVWLRVAPDAVWVFAE